jgi:hypothetical protein
VNVLHIAVYITGLCAVGFVAGFFAGSSSSPVVGVVLPLVFGMIGGASGLAVTKFNLNKPKEVKKLAILGIALISFSFTLWFGSLFGASIRLGDSLQSILLNKATETKLLDGSNTATESVALALLQARMQALGLGQNDISELVKQASNEMKERRKGLPKIALDTLHSELENSLRLMESSNANVFNIQKFLLWQATNFESVAYAGSDVRPSQVLFLGELRGSIWPILNNPDVNELPNELKTSLIKLHNGAMSLEAWLRTPSWVGANPLTEDIDSFISLKTSGSVLEPKNRNIFVMDNKKTIPGI